METNENKYEKRSFCRNKKHRTAWIIMGIVGFMAFIPFRCDRDVALELAYAFNFPPWRNYVLAGSRPGYTWQTFIRLLTSWLPSQWTAQFWTMEAQALHE